MNKKLKIALGVIGLLFVFSFIGQLSSKDTHDKEAKGEKSSQIEEKTKEQKEAEQDTKVKKETEQDTKAKKEAEEKAKKEAEEKAKKEAEEKAKKEAKEKESNYENKMSSIASRMSTTMGEFSKKQFEAADNPYLLYDQDWIIETSIKVAEVQNIIDESRQIKAPKKYENAHSLLMKAMNEYEKFTTKYPSAVDNMDADEMANITTYIQNGNQYVQEYSELIGK